MSELKGPRKKPAYCIKNCVRQASATGFVPDTVTDSTKILVLKYQPSTEEVNFREANIDSWKSYAALAGVDQSEVGVAYMLRCHGNPKEHKNIRVKSQKNCRNFDSSTNDGGGRTSDKGGIEKFDPNIFIITFDTSQLEKADAFRLFFRKAFQLAKDFVTKGYRPVILCGLEVAELIQPELFSSQDYDRDLTFRSWVGHWWYGDWPFIREEKQKLFNIKSEAKRAIKNL